MAKRPAHWVECKECEGAGRLTDGHPHDPNAHTWACDYCGGEGWLVCEGCEVCEPEEPQVERSPDWIHR